MIHLRIIIRERSRQIRMEIFDIIDENGNPTGKTVERSIAHAEGIRHRTAHIWIIRRKNGRTEILLQKRSRNKDSFPGNLILHLQATYRQGMNRWNRALRGTKGRTGDTCSARRSASLQENSRYLCQRIS